MEKKKCVRAESVLCNKATYILRIIKSLNLNKRQFSIHLFSTTTPLPLTYTPTSPLKKEKKERKKERKSNNHLSG